MKRIAYLNIIMGTLLFVGCQVTSEKIERNEDPAFRTFHPTRSSLSHLKAGGLTETGLRPVYPDDVDCPKISSLFAARTRGDGSFRSLRFFHGYHGGIDIPVPEGTPILAIANGTVVRKKARESIGGIEITLQHTPDDTGLSVWIYSQYKHLKEMPAIKIGERVEMGERIALAGSTGTRGIHYGPGGHSHLHLSTFLSPTKDYRGTKVFVPFRGEWIDPLALHMGKDLHSKSIRSLPDKDKKVKIPYLTIDGKVVPENSLFIWPFSCTPY